MTPTVQPEDVERFRSAIARCLGLLFDDARLGFLAEVLRRRLLATRCEAWNYVAQIDMGPAEQELAALAQELTVGETYFFRHSDQFRAFSERVVPDRMRTRAATRQLTVLSAGCSSGEEAYTLAILMRQISDPSWRTSVLAVDVNPTVLEKAKRARFSRWALRETAPEVQSQWFEPDGNEFVLSDAIRKAVTFQQTNLAADDPGLWKPTFYDVVFCRNVIMYLTPEAGQSLVARITRALAPGGYLFLGHAETLRGLSQEYHLCHTHGTFYYERKDGEASPTQWEPATIDLRERRVTDPLLALVDQTGTWAETIQLATDRVHRLTESSSANGSGTPTWSLDGSLRLLEEERFAEALALVEELPVEAANDPDALLLHAVLLTHSGALERAERACWRLLEIDELNAGAHYLLALCHEGREDRAGAVEHDRVAVYLDPGFAMPRLHLGLLARRAGQTEVVRRELAHVATLLQREDAARLLLFGGGFNRDALIALCRAELLACGTT